MRKSHVFLWNNGADFSWKERDYYETESKTLF